MKIEFVNLKRQLYGTEGVRGIIDSIKGKLEKCIENTSFTMGPFLEEFEKKFSEFCNTRYCIGLNSGTDALEFALIANDVTSGNVITVPNSYFTTSSSISQAGSTPNFVDVDKYFNIDVKKIEQVIDKETKAILPVHLYGLPCNMNEIEEIARRYNLKIIEDCCHAPGARYHNKNVPIKGAGAFSFFPGKNMGAWGDAGAIVTNSKEIAEKAKLLRNDGSLVKYNHEILGRKSRMHSIQAVILSEKLKHLDDWNNKRREHARYYNHLLKDVEEINLPFLGNEDLRPVFHIYPILTKEREKLKEYLEGQGISVGVHYPIPIHLQPAYKNLGYKKGDFPNAEKMTDQELSLPMFPELSRDEIEYISKKIHKFFRR